MGKGYLRKRGEPSGRTDAREKDHSGILNYKESRKRRKNAHRGDGKFVRRSGRVQSPEKRENIRRLTKGRRRASYKRKKEKISRNCREKKQFPSVEEEEPVPSPPRMEPTGQWQLEFAARTRRRELGPQQKKHISRMGEKERKVANATGAEIWHCTNTLSRERAARADNRAVLREVK